MNRRVFTVTQVNSYIKAILENDAILNGIFVEAEISNLKFHTSGHVYFTLKDSGAAINCVMFKGQASSLPFRPENGMNVILYGRVSLYEKTGQYQIYAEFMEPAGKGALYAAFEQLKKTLEAQGLFEEAHKKPIPSYPKRIAIITSETGAAVRDIIQVATRRNKNVALVVVPVLVQGSEAALDIVRAIDDVNKWGEADLIILGRGGGSIEDLWAFNEEPVARAVYASKIPVISAVGHETDFTIVDFVADLRAPTPSAAAEIAVPALIDTRSGLLALTALLHKVMNNILSREKSALESLMKSRVFTNPGARIYDTQIYLENLTKNLNRIMDNRLSQARLLYGTKTSRLESVSPLGVLRRGYSITSDSSGKVIPSVKSLKAGQLVTVGFHDGAVSAKVIGFTENVSEVNIHGKKEIGGF